MNRFAKGIALCLVLLISLALFGCAEEPPATIAPITDWDDGSSWVMTRFYSTSALSDEGYYFPVDDILYFADTSNGIAVCLCSKPGCLHEKGSPQEQAACDASLKGTAATPMFFWNDHIFHIRNDEYGTHVYRRNADGTALTAVADIGSRYVKERKALEINDSAFLGDYFYYSAIVMSPVSEDGEETRVEDMAYIARLNLKTNKEEILVESEQALFFNAVCPDGLLYYYYEDTEADREDEDYSEQRKKAPAYVQFYDFETKETTTILQRTYQDLQSVSAVRGSKLYYTRSVENGGGIWEYDMKTGSDRKVSDTSGGSQIDGRLVFKRVDGNSVLYHLPTGQFLPTAFAGERLKAVCVSKDAVILTRTLFEGGRSTSSVYCYVKLADLADGLQEEDVLDLYTYYYKKVASSYEEMLDQMGG